MSKCQNQDSPAKGQSPLEVKDAVGVKGLVHTDANSNLPLLSEHSMLDGQENVENSFDKESKVELSQIKMPPKMLKRGRPKGAELTVLGIPKSKRSKPSKSSHALKPYSKQKAEDKNRIILECLTNSKLAAKEALNGSRLLEEKDIQSNVHLLPDTVRDRENIDISRVEKYFNDETWLLVLKLMEKKDNCKWACFVCQKAIVKLDRSIICDHCFLWCHFDCISLKKKAKCRNWSCTSRKVKYSER